MAAAYADGEALAEDYRVQARRLFGQSYHQLSSEQKSHIRAFAQYRAEIRTDASRSYQQLTAAEKDRLHQLYESIPPGDEPPYPLQGVWSYSDPLGEIALRRQLVGSLTVLLDIDSGGQVIGLNLLAAPEGAPWTAIEQILKAIPFKPAVCSGQACAMQYLVQMDFSMERR